jgi:hypothetical protein
MTQSILLFLAVFFTLYYSGQLRHGRRVEKVSDMSPIVIVQLLTALFWALFYGAKN